MTDEEKYNLELFRDKVQELISSKFLRNENFIKFLEGAEPDEEQITFLLSKYRFFYLNDERTHFYSICNILFKNAKNEKQKNLLRILEKLTERFLRGVLVFPSRIN
jgi:hypothetical protein